MPPSNGSPSIENRLTRVELAVQRLEGQVSQLLSEFAGLKERVEEMICKLEDHQEVLYGEHGKSGLIAQAETLEELRNALKGIGREPGLIADIRNLTVKMSGLEDGRKWLTRLILGAVLTDIVLHFIQVSP